MVSVLWGFLAAEDRGLHKTGASPSRPTPAPHLWMSTNSIAHVLGLEPNVQLLALSVGTRCPSSPKWGWELPGEKGYSKGFFSLSRQLGPHLMTCGSQFTGAPSWHLFPTPLSEGRLGSLEATAVGVFTLWKLASAFLFPPGEPAMEH